MNKFKEGDIVYLIKNGIQTFAPRRPYLEEYLTAPIGTRYTISHKCSCSCGGYGVSELEDVIPAHCLTKDFKTPKGNKRA